MSEPTAAEIREWAKRTDWRGPGGEPVADRGKLPPGIRQDYELYAMTKDPEPDGPDYDEGVTEADFPPDPPEETRPRPVRPPKKTDAFLARVWGQKRKPGRAKPKRPRMPADKLISGVWRIGARVLAPVDVPVARVLQTQAPVAGVLLDPIIKETLLDRVLQPLARIEEGGEVVFALAGPPVLVGLLHRFPQAADILVPALEEAVVTWMTIAGPALVEAEKKKAEFREQYGADVEDLVKLWFAGVPGFDPAADPAAADAGEPVAA